MKKQRVSVYLEPDVMRALADFAARRGQSRSLVAEAAIASFLSPDAAERQEAVTGKRLDQLDRRMTRMERDLGISVETLAVFVRFWLTTSPPLPEPAQAAARAKAKEAFGDAAPQDQMAAQKLGKKAGIVKGYVSEKNLQLQLDALGTQTAARVLQLSRPLSFSLKKQLRKDL